MTAATPPHNHPLGQHMETELRSQPDMWHRAVAQNVRGTALPKPGERVAIVGCGTSWFMAQAYALLRENAGLGHTDAFTASEFPRGRNYDVCLALSRSGTTSEILDLLGNDRIAKRSVAIVGDLSSPLPALVDDVVALPYADEESVVQTRFATTALILLRASLGENLDSVIVDAHDALSSDLPEQLLTAEQMSFIGLGWCAALAAEAALKLREAAQLWTESYQAMEYRHGPIAIAAPGRVTWGFGELPAGLEATIAHTGAHLEHANRDPLADLIRVHRVALERARAQGIDPDAPRHLTRSVILHTDETP